MQKNLKNLKKFFFTKTKLTKKHAHLKKHKSIESCRVFISGMRVLGIALLCCICLVCPVEGVLHLAWNPPSTGWKPPKDWEHTPRINTKPTWPPHVPCKAPHCIVNTTAQTAQNRSKLTSTPIVASWLLNRAQKKQLQHTIYEQTQLIIELQQKLTAYELKEELREFWITELQDVRWAGWAKDELLVVSRVNVSDLRPKP